MLSKTDCIPASDERRHVPGPDSLPLWNESYWFPIYDPRQRIGLVTRIGILPNQGEANLWMFISKDGRIVHDATDLHCPLPEGDVDALTLKNVTYQCLEPLRAWRILYDGGNYGCDLLWEAVCPAYLYPTAEGARTDQAPHHVEQSARVRGTVTVAGREYSLQCMGHRDHSWGGERDWSKMPTWTYVSCEFDEQLSFNTVKISHAADNHFKVGFFWDGEHVMGLRDFDIDLQTNEARTRQIGACLWVVNEKGRRLDVRARVLDVCPVTIGPTQVNDAIVEFRAGDRVGYGIIEYGYQLRDCGA